MSTTALRISSGSSCVFFLLILIQSYAPVFPKVIPKLAARHCATGSVNEVLSTDGARIRPGSGVSPEVGGSLSLLADAPQLALLSGRRRSLK